MHLYSIDALSEITATVRMLAIAHNTQSRPANCQSEGVSAMLWVGMQLITPSRRE